MARREYGGTLEAFTTTSAGIIRGGLDVYTWTARTGGTRINDLQAVTGSIVGGGSIGDVHLLTGPDASIDFLGPDGYSADGIWVSADPSPAAPRLWLRAQDITGSGGGGGGGGAVSSVNGKTGAVTLSAADTGAQPAGTYATLASGTVPDAQLPARLAAVQLATAIATAVSAEHQLLVGDSPAALDTIRELSAALGDDPNKITTLTAAIGAKYAKPNGGIPAADLASDVPTAAQVAAKYTKPGNGIPSTDLASGVIPDLAPYLKTTDANAAYGQVLVYANGSYPARPVNAPAGLVKYIGPVQPTTWLTNDEWVNNA